jgi:hypothetical protein
MSERLTTEGQRDYVGVVPGGKLVYVLMEKRVEFDKIALPVTDHGEHLTGHVLSKSMDGDGVYVVFQYWLKSRTHEALSADLAAERARKEQP